MKLIPACKYLFNLYTLSKWWQEKEGVERRTHRINPFPFIQTNILFLKFRKPHMKDLNLVFHQLSLEFQSTCYQSTSSDLIRGSNSVEDSLWIVFELTDETRQFSVKLYCYGHRSDPNGAELN